MTTLPRTSEALATCQAHLDSLGSSTPPVDPDPFFLTLLTRSLIVSLCSEVEQTVERLVVAYIERDCTGGGAASLIRTKRRNLLNNARFKEICDVIGLLDSTRSDLVRSLVAERMERAPEILGNAVTERDNVNHGAPRNVTYEEFCSLIFPAGTTIVDAVRIALEDEPIAEPEL